MTIGTSRGAWTESARRWEERTDQIRREKTRERRGCVMGDGGAGSGNGAGGRWEETDLIDETDGIDAILRDEVTAAAAEPSEHRTGECARRVATVDYENERPLPRRASDKRPTSDFQY